MYVPDQVDVFASPVGAASEYPAGIGSLAPGGPQPSGGLGAADLLKLGRSGLSALKLISPATYGEMTSFIPTWGEIGSTLGLDGLLGSGGALGGAMAALGPAGLAFGLANLLAAIPNSDGSVSYGGGIGSLQDGYSGLPASRGLYDQWVGGKDWYEGGNPTGVSLGVDTGSMSRKSTQPYFSVGGVPYQTPELAVNSGRQIARGMMGLPVPYERVPNAFDPINGAQDLARYQGTATMPVYDAPAPLPDDWDLMMDRQNRMGGYGEGQTSLDVGLDAWKAGLDPRQRQFFYAGLNRQGLWGATGPDMANDPIYDTSIADGTQKRYERVAAASGEDNPQPFDPSKYGFGPGRIFNPIRSPGAYPGS